MISNRVTIINNDTLRHLVSQYQLNENSLEYEPSAFRALSKIIENCATEILVFWWANESIPSPFLEYLSYPKYYKDRSDFVDQYENTLEKTGKFLYVVTGSFLTSEMKKNYEEFPLKNTEILVWKTCMLHEISKLVENKFNKKINEIEINKNFNHLYFSLNGKARENREMLIDTLAKYDLLKYGKVTRNDWGESLGFRSDYKFKYWKKEDLKIDYYDGIDIGSYHFLNRIIVDIDCLINVVGETLYYNNFCFHTEKTYLPILLGRPFLVQSTVNHFKELTESFGIELYDEIFDYSFDQVYDLEEKTELIVKQLIDLKDQNYKEIYLKLQDKLKTNREILINHITEDIYFPQKLGELVRYSPDSFRNNMISTYEQLMKLSFN